MSLHPSSVDAEKVTRRFFERFRTEHAALRDAIQGVADEDARTWYASVLLNRLMFLYFLQQKGFLDGDRQYLAGRLRAVAENTSFYEDFLRPFFHGALSRAPVERASTDDRLGRIPYLGGGLFDAHPVERRYDSISIPNDAFTRVFALFDEYHWHADERPAAGEREITPEILGHIFENYINQKQMGAYYTKEDITAYMSESTLLPLLLERMSARHPSVLAKDGGIGALLRQSPDQYIRPEVLHGADRELPAPIAAGLDDPGAQDSWNRPAPAEYALPTETWRDCLARRHRAQDLRARLRGGEIADLDALVVENLDLRRAVTDLIAGASDPALIQCLWEELVALSVLDPTCGSGAFLFAALNVLEPVYLACLDAMQRLLDAAERAGGAIGAILESFRRVLDRVRLHANRRYFVLKSIVVENLFGVDLMEEAVEICKLRLFLKLVAQLDSAEQIEPLPDIDFNIRPGNTLVGFTSLAAVRAASRHDGAQARMLLLDEQAVLDRIERNATAADGAFQRFRDLQTEGTPDSATLTAAKSDLADRLGLLRAELDARLAVEYGVREGDGAGLRRFRATHHPFHFFVEFYGIMKRGGFDAILGNPPYIARSKVEKSYKLRHFRTQAASDIYAMVLERSAEILRDGGRSGMIVPLSLTFSGDFDSCRRLLLSTYDRNWFSSFGRIPSALFSFDVRVRNTIHLGRKGPDRAGVAYTTRLHRWFGVARPHLFPTLAYAELHPARWGHRIAKVGTTPLASAFEARLGGGAKTLESALSPSPTPHELHFKKTAYNWLNFCIEQPPCFDRDGGPIPHTKFGTVHFPDADSRDLALLLLNGKLMLAWWFFLGDDFDLTRWMFAEFPVDLGAIAGPDRERLLQLARELDATMRGNVTFKLNAGKRVGNYNLARCRPVTDRSDRIFARLLGLDAVWEEIQLLYSQVVKTDFEEDEE